jgi:DNA-binding response OmpR family regulator
MSARHSISILLVDGDETLQSLRTLMLRLRGYRVERVATLQDARRRTTETHFGLVLVDVAKFPDAGLPFCEEVKAMRPGIKVAFLANHTLYLPADACPDDVIARQDGPEQFLSRVDELVADSV